MGRTLELVRSRIALSHWGVGRPAEGIDAQFHAGVANCVLLTLPDGGESMLARHLWEDLAGPPLYCLDVEHAADYVCHALVVGMGNP